MLGSNFVRSLVREMVAEADDLEIVGELDDEPGAELTLLEIAMATRPDFVVVAMRAPEVADVHLQLLERCPRTKVLAVAAGSDGASLWELQPQRRLFVEISPETLRKAIRESDWTAAGVR